MTNTDDIMNVVGKILAVSVLIDKKQRDREMIEFVHTVSTINQRVRPGVILPRQTILAWFEAEKPEIEAKIADDENDVWKSQLLDLIEDPELRRMVLSAMFAISVCDYELKDVECDFLKLAVETWNTGLPNMDDMVLMAG